MKKYITADDFGYSKGVNIAISNLLKEGLLTRASLMVNMPYFKDAVELIKKYDLKNIGLHFNITQGKSVSNDGRIHFKKGIYDFPYETFVEDELYAQIDMMTSNGISINHIDTHHNIHLESDYLTNCLKKYNTSIRTPNCSALKSYSDIDGIMQLCDNNIDEFVVHPSVSIYDLYDTNLKKSRVNDYLFLMKNKDIIKQIIHS